MLSNPNKTYSLINLDFGVICTLVCGRFPIWSEKMYVFHFPRENFVTQQAASVSLPGKNALHLTGKEIHSYEAGYIILEVLNGTQH